MEWEILRLWVTKFHVIALKNKHRNKILAALATKACLDTTNADLLKWAALKTHTGAVLSAGQNPQVELFTQLKVSLIQWGGTKQLKLQHTV